MFRRPTDPPDYTWMYGIPAAAFIGGASYGKMVGFNDMTQVAYLVGKYVNLMMPELILGCSTNSKRFCQFEKQKVRCGREQFVVPGL